MNIEAWYDQYGNYCTGYDAHVKAWRYWTGRKYEQYHEAMRTVANQA